MAPLPVGEAGLVLVRGANVVRGYLGRDDLTAAAMQEGCYITGDISRLDDDGFLFLIDRLSRFSKIGGELVPHGSVEEHVQQCSGRDDRSFAVCGVPDAKKGERLMVLTTLRPEELPPLLRQLAGRGLPPLFVPRVSGSGRRGAQVSSRSWESGWMRGTRVPGFVVRELGAYLRCGILAHAFCRVHCDACEKDELVALSCKRRGFCPSCMGRRMADLAANLVDSVLPDESYRQWALALPSFTRRLCAYDASLCTAVRRVMVRPVL